MSDVTAPVAQLQIWPLTGIGEVQPGDDLAALIAGAAGDTLADGDVLVVTSKVVSKAEGRLVPVPADPHQRQAARQRAIDGESVREVARRGPTRIVATRHGLVLAAAGIDASNVDSSHVVLLPVDPDASARQLRRDLAARLGVDVAVVVTDTMGRPWRLGLTDVAIGAAGIVPLRDHRGEVDSHGNELSLTQVAVIDELSAAAELVKGKSAGICVAVVRGMMSTVDAGAAGAASLARPVEQDLFSLGTAEARALGRREAAALILGPVPPLSSETLDPDLWAYACQAVSGVALYVELRQPEAREAVLAALPSAGTAAGAARVLALFDDGTTLSDDTAVVTAVRAALATSGLALHWLDAAACAKAGLLDAPPRGAAKPLGVAVVGHPAWPDGMFSASPTV